MQKFIFTLLIVIIVIITNLSYAQRWTLAGVVLNPGEEPSISVIDNNNVWVAGGTPDTPRVYKTTNGGQEWQLVNTNGITKEIYCIWAVSFNTVFVAEGGVSSNAKLYKTTNSGETWTIILQTGINEGYFNSLVFSPINPLVGAALADKLYITTNGGVSWIVQANIANSGSAHNSLMLIDENFYGFGLTTGVARVKVTTNGGVNWLVQNININGSYTSGLAYKENKMIGVASTSASMPYIARTTNSGNTWTPINIGSGLTGKTLLKWIYGTNIVYILGENGAIKRSTNAGLNWLSLDSAGVDGLTHFSFVNLNNIIYGYAVSKYGYVIKLVDSVQYFLTGIKYNNLSFDYKLLQNYPNPFNPVTVIGFEIPKASYVKLTVYDALGKQVEILANGLYQAGQYQIEWHASRYQSGLYFYRLISDYFIETKKMIFIK